MLIIQSIFKAILIQFIYAKSIQDFLTKKSSRIWLQNETHIGNSANAYCSICCVDVAQLYKGRKCGVHTMCAYESKWIGTSCSGMILMDFSQSEIDAIVDAHNTIRNRIAMGLETEGNPGPQPPAANMRLMSWDTELSTIASVWASQCVFSHDMCRDLDRFPVGQNMAQGSYALKNDLEHIADWYELVQYFNKRMLESHDQENQADLSDYTQLVWADTYLVGCARVSFQKSVNGQIIYKEHFFCNYGPSGNIPHQPVYKIGEACSACSEGTYCINPEYPGLCGNEILNVTFLQDQRRKRTKQLGNNHSNRLISFCINYVLLVVYYLYF